MVRDDHFYVGRVGGLMCYLDKVLELYSLGSSSKGNLGRYLYLEIAFSKYLRYAKSFCNVVTLSYWQLYAVY